MPDTNILITAGEVSGDLHAAPVAVEIKRLIPAASFFGTGGAKMHAEGVELLSRVENLAVMGFSDIPRILPHLSRLKRKIVERVRDQHVRLAVLVDYPGFNLNLAKALKRLPNPPLILEYIAPQVWAWRSGRIKTVRRLIDHLAVVFPFEEELFRAAGVNATFVGHPLLDEMDILSAGSRVEQPGDADPDSDSHRAGSPLLALLPGSRRSVVMTHLPVMMHAVDQLVRELPDLRVGIGRAPVLEPSIFEKYLKGEQVRIWDNSRELLAAADAAVICSGTSTLEAALIGVPQVVVYKTTFLNYHVIKHLINLKHVALVNIVAGEKIVPELLQNDFTTRNITSAILPLLTSTVKRKELAAGYSRIRELLGDKGAARRVAEIAVDMLQQAAL